MITLVKQIFSRDLSTRMKYRPRPARISEKRKFEKVETQHRTLQKNIKPQTSSSFQADIKPAPNLIKENYTGTWTFGQS